jgi:citrate synthase
MVSASGLEGVVFADTSISDVDGERGRLIIRGHHVEELVEKSTFEDIGWLVWNGELPRPDERKQLRSALGRARVDALDELPSLGGALKARDGMDALRASTAHLIATGDSHIDRVQLTAAIAVFVAAWARTQAGQQPLAPDASLSHAADYLRMLSGSSPDQASIRAVDAYLCCVVDHGMNASTFAARVVTSTGSDMVSAVVAAIGALKGPLHGGAPGPVLDMLDAIGQPDGARAWLETALAAGQRIMGMGHRIYRVRDPRAAALERAATAFEQSGVTAERLRLARAVERDAETLLARRHPDRALRANVEFYTAVLLEAAGIPRTLFSPTFAASRVVGWCAHVEEQRAHGRLVRPASTYVGPAPAAEP